jgi:hypothetical protein
MQRRAIAAACLVVGATAGTAASAGADRAGSLQRGGWVAVDRAVGNGQPGQLGTLKARLVSTTRSVHGEPPNVSIKLTLQLRAVGETGVVLIDAEPGQNQQQAGPELALLSPADGACENIGKWKGHCLLSLSGVGSGFAKYEPDGCPGGKVLNAAAIPTASSDCTVEATYATYGLGPVVKLHELAVLWKSVYEKGSPTHVIAGGR